MTPTPPSESPNPGSVWPPPPTQPVAADARRPFASLIPLSRVIAVLGVLDIIGGVGVTLVKARQVALSGVPGDILLVLLAGVIFLAVFVAYRVLFLRWLFVAYKNLDVFEAAGLETTAGWAVGWIFIPVANLYRPYLTLHELYKAGTPGVDSRDEIAWQRVPSSPLIGWWWSSILIDLFLPKMVDKVLTHGITETASGILNFVLELVSITLTIVLVGSISRRQEAKAREIAPSAPSYL
ncbi:hypothetical protein CCAX7_006290 [Capsulimonas corticalis]|uniref:DUF4328 domain-containing protein n=1 Tax=Capsulimonas corticalis TaxID=2219043 RepID=A0A402D3G0_9BACT|nr:DUF4328 domain-containing protein [Capsulimonas corticalis]BDI28578.1 hypothetical protein CCAX7_006290 [Capsulimonas corticalis]